MDPPRDKAAPESLADASPSPGDKISNLVHGLNIPNKFFGFVDRLAVAGAIHGPRIATEVSHRTEELGQTLERAREFMLQGDNIEVAAGVAGAVVGAALAPVVGPVGLAVLGWAADGVQAGSLAAAAQAAIGNVAAGSPFAVAQSVGAGGAMPAVGLIGGAAVGGLAAYLLAKHIKENAAAYQPEAEVLAMRALLFAEGVASKVPTEQLTKFNIQEDKHVHALIVAAQKKLKELRKGDGPDAVL